MIKNFAKISNGAVVNVAIAEDVWPFGDDPHVECPDGFGVGDLYDGVSFSKPAPIPPTLEQIKASVQSKIDTLEKTSMIPRITREFMLVSFAVQAAAQGIDPMTNIAYSKLKALDDQIATLRSQL